MLYFYLYGHVDQEDGYQDENDATTTTRGTFLRNRRMQICFNLGRTTNTQATENFAAAGVTQTHHEGRKCFI